MRPQIKLKHWVQLVNSLSYQILLHFKLISSLKWPQIHFYICKSKITSGKSIFSLKS